MKLGYLIVELIYIVSLWTFNVQQNMKKLIASCTKCFIMIEFLTIVKNYGMCNNPLIERQVQEK